MSFTWKNVEQLQQQKRKKTRVNTQTFFVDKLNCFFWRRTRWHQFTDHKWRQSIFIWNFINQLLPLITSGPKIEELRNIKFAIAVWFGHKNKFIASISTLFACKKTRHVIYVFQFLTAKIEKEKSRKTKTFVCATMKIQ